MKETTSVSVISAAWDDVATTRNSISVIRVFIDISPSDALLI
jgi:hypothetical protein